MEILENQHIETKIYEIRGTKVMLDSDLAILYHVETKRINEAVRRNLDRFPSDLMFEITKDELENQRSQNATFKESLKNRKYLQNKVYTCWQLY